MLVLSGHDNPNPPELWQDIKDNPDKVVFDERTGKETLDLGVPKEECGDIIPYED